MMPMVSLSRRWLMETIMPKDMQAEMISLTETSIMVASSDAVTNSVNSRVCAASI